MFGFGDELIIQSNRIPWLIWIQILVTFLLTLAILVSLFGFSALDSSSSSPTSDSLSSASSRRLGPLSIYSATTQEPIPKERMEVGRNPEAWVEMTTSTGSNRGRGVENNSETDGSSVEDLTPKPISERLYHPCRFLDIAKEAFLKCLGLGSSSRDSPPREQTHED